MKHAILVMSMVLSLTACDSPQSGAEISSVSDSVISDQAAPSAGEPADTATQPAIDAAPSTAATYAEAVSSCDSAGRQLCTVDQYEHAYALTDLEFTWGQPGNYWMQLTNLGSGNRNLFQASNIGMAYMFVTTDNARKFYCCEK